MFEYQPSELIFYYCIFSKFDYDRSGFGREVPAMANLTLFVTKAVRRHSGIPVEYFTLAENKARADELVRAEMDSHRLDRNDFDRNDFRSIETTEVTQCPGIIAIRRH